MNFILALLPVVAIVSLGQLLARLKLLPPEGWRAVERLCYMVLFPVMIVTVLAGASFETAPWRVAAACLGAQAVLTVLGLTARAFPRVERRSVGSIVQSNARWNTMIALSVAGAMFGAEGVALVAVVAATIIPTANLISVTALSHFGDPPEGARRHPLRELVRNPILIACMIGGALNLSGLAPKGVVLDTLDTLGDSAVAIGLLTAGAGVDLAALRTTGPQTLIWSLVRLCGFPLAAAGFAAVLGVTGVQLAVVVICAATPTASMGYILARQLGGDAPLMANLIAVQTVLAAVSMPILFALLAGG